ncbi:hypothetical protein B0H13DRAFT_2244742 [Mycena leptocephala]|nr:hypothetical protein B0H13DRAFT_2244742 [Mycena leptocephala]
MYFDHTPPLRSDQHRRKRASQWQRWQVEVIPQLLPHFARVLQESSPSAKWTHATPPEVPVTAAPSFTKSRLSAFPVCAHLVLFEIELCKCWPAAIQLMQIGVFGCAPILPSLAVDLQVLEFTTNLFLQISPNNTAMSITLECVLADMGFQLDHQHSRRRCFGNCLMWYTHMCNQLKDKYSLRPSKYLRSPKYHPDTHFVPEDLAAKMEAYVNSVRNTSDKNEKHHKRQEREVEEEEEDGYDHEQLLLPRSVLDGCEASFKAADEKRETASTEFFEDTTLMALLCRHDRVLWVVNMHSAGEKQFAVILLIEMLFKHLQADVRIGILYDIACLLERSCLKWGFLSRFIDRIAFAVSVFHAFGHEWACQLLYHPHKRTGFGYSNGEGCEHFWNSIRHLIAHLRISGYHNRLYTLDAQIHHTDETSLLRLGQWVARRRAHCVGKRAEATKALRECRKAKSLLRDQWKLQVAAQTKPLPRRTKTRGQKAVNAVMLLRAALKTRQAQVQELRQKFLDAVEDEDLLAAIYQTDLDSAQDALHQAEIKLWRKEEALGVGQHQELEALANSVYMRCRMNTRALKLRLRQRLRARKFELDPKAPALIERPDSKLHAHTASAVKRQELTISKLASEYNKLCAQIAKIIEDGQAPPGSIAPVEIPPKGLWQLDVDDTIFQDVGLDEDDNATASTEPPLWLCDEQVRAGIKAVLALDRCDEEDARLLRETCSLRVWFAEEWKMVQRALLDTGMSLYLPLCCTVR